MDLRILIGNKLSKGIGIRVFYEKQFPLSVSMDDGLRLIGIKKGGIRVASGKIFSFIDRVRRIGAARCSLPYAAFCNTR